MIFYRTFDLDVCASSHNAKCKRYITAEQERYPYATHDNHRLLL
ncbi:DNA N-6-adenine-methyltransferase, partial [Glaesserella parasuis]